MNKFIFIFLILITISLVGASSPSYTNPYLPKLESKEKPVTGTGGSTTNNYYINGSSENWSHYDALTNVNLTGFNLSNVNWLRPNNIFIGNATINMSIYPYVDDYWNDARIYFYGRGTFRDWFGIRADSTSTGNPFPGLWFYDEGTGVSALWELNYPSNYFSFESYDLPIQFTGYKNMTFLSSDIIFDGTSAGIKINFTDNYVCIGGECRNTWPQGNLTFNQTLTDSLYEPIVTDCGSGWEYGDVKMSNTTTNTACWKVANSSDGTIDLRNRFIVGATDTYSLASTGGTTSHDHQKGTIAAGTVASTLTAGEKHTVGTGTVMATNTHTHPGPTITGATATNSTLPPYYALVYKQCTCV